MRVFRRAPEAVSAVPARMEGDFPAKNWTAELFLRRFFGAFCRRERTRQQIGSKKEGRNEAAAPGRG